MPNVGPMSGVGIEVSLNPIKTDPLIAAVYCAVNGHNFIQGMRSQIDNEVTHYMRCIHCGTVETVEEVSRLEALRENIVTLKAQENIPQKIACKLIDHDLVPLKDNGMVFAGQDKMMKCSQCGEIFTIQNSLKT